MVERGSTSKVVRAYFARTINVIPSKHNNAFATQVLRHRAVWKKAKLAGREKKTYKIAADYIYRIIYHTKKMPQSNYVIYKTMLSCDNPKAKQDYISDCFKYYYLFKIHFLIPIISGGTP